ncbi:MAG: HEAT repeat domain-containing protein [Pirellulales bacterium]|nr:HEAT repeat domain-containing protein [Pirellulales bacterium]
MTSTIPSVAENRGSASFAMDAVKNLAPLTEPDLSSDSGEESAFENLVTSLSNAGGLGKQRIADEILHRLRSCEDVATRAAWVAYLILTSKRPGRVDDCVGLFSRLGPNIVEEMIMVAARAHPISRGSGSSWVDDYWFALVRSLGFLSRQNDRKDSSHYCSLAVCYSTHRIPALREAAVAVLADIGDEKAMARLKCMSQNDGSPLVRRLAQEMIEEAEESIPK